MCFLISYSLYIFRKSIGVQYDMVEIKNKNIQDVDIRFFLLQLNVIYNFYYSNVSQIYLRSC